MYTPYPSDYPLREELLNYSEDVLSEKIIACQKHKWACFRFLHDLEREGTEEFPYVFDEHKALKFLNWMKLFRHRKGILRGQRIDPHIIQRFVFGNIYGWIHKDTGYRRFKKAYWQVARKNAKSQSLATVGTYEQMAMGEGYAEVYCAATKTDQARIVWNEAEAMLNSCKELKGKYRVAYNTIYHTATGSPMLALSKQDQKEGDGFDPQCGIIDEYHAHRTDEIYNVLSSGMVARPQPLLMTITTAGYNLSNPCYRVEYRYVSKILDPHNPTTNEEYFVMINELDKDEDGNLIDDIRDEKAWEKANPIVCSYPEGINNLRRFLREALESPDKMRDFLTKNLNVWIDQKELGYMRMDKWAICKGDIPDLTGRECYVGVDLSSKIDLTSVSFSFPLPDKKYAVLSHSFIPKDRLQERIKTDNVPFDMWVEEDWLTATEGAVIDYEYIKEYIKKKAEEGWIIKEICYDPYNATQFAQDMIKDGYKLVEIRQGIRTLGEPTKNFRECVYSNQIIHDDNPVLTWAIGNAITKQDAQENIMLDKSKSTDRIDPISALINAHTRAMHHEYNNPYDPNKYVNDEIFEKLGW